MRTPLVIAALAASSLAAPSAHADWTGKARIGGVIARGNTDSRTANANLDLENAVGRWKHKFGGSMLRTLTEDVTSANRWEARAESEFTPTDRVFSWLSSRYENDRFATYAYQVTGAIGVGYHFLATERSKLDAKIGAGLRRAEQRLTDETEEDVIARGQLELQHKLTGNTTVFNRYLIEHGETNTFTQNVLGLEVKMTEALGLAITWEIRRNTELLPPATHNSDQVVTLGLAAGF